VGDYTERYRQIGRNIAYFRNRKKLSQEELAYKVGVSKSYISKIEAPNSKKTFSLDILFALADILEVDICTLIAEPAKPETAPKSNNKDLDR
jgi:transcriptional regulator with XRE-family HTH domain